MILDCKCPHCGGDLVLSMRGFNAPAEDVDPFARAKEIMREEAERAGITLEELLGPRRQKHIWAARKTAIRRSTAETGLSSTRLGRLFRRDHTSILNALRG